MASGLLGALPFTMRPAAAGKGTARTTRTELPEHSLVQQGAELIQFAPVTILSYLWPDSAELNARLRAVILAKMESSGGVLDTNVGGWHSERDLATWSDAPVAVLLERVRLMARALVAVTVRDATPVHLADWEIEGWANVNRRGAFNKSHHHAGGRNCRNLWSGIYYVDHGGVPGGGVASGVTRFEDRSGVPKEILRCADPFEREMTIVPESGLMVFFPASLRHYVTPYEGDRDRITIAFNLKHDAFVIPKYPEDEERPSFLWRNFRGPMLIGRRLRQALGGLRGR